MIRDFFKRLVGKPRAAVSPEPAPVVEKPAPTQTTECTPEGFLATWTAAKRCPFCAGEKPTGQVMCKPCDDCREPFRKARTKRTA